MLNTKVVLLIFIFLYSFFVSCNDNNEITAIKIDNENYYKNYFSKSIDIKIDNEQLKNKILPSVISLSGSFYKDAIHYYAFSDYFSNIIYYYNTATKKIENEFKIPIPIDLDRAYVYQVINTDSIIYFDYPNQRLIITGSEKIKHTYTVDFDEQFNHSYMMVERNDPQLNVVNGNYLLYLWIKYGPDPINYDSLMDNKPLVGFFTPIGDKFVYKKIPVYPIIKRSVTTEKREYDSSPFAVYNDIDNIIVIGNASSDIFQTYNIKTGIVKKQKFLNSSYAVNPVLLNKKYTMEELQKAADLQLFTKVYYYHKKNIYLRTIFQKFYDKEGIMQEKYILQIINKRFEVIDEFPIPARWLTQLNDEIFLSLPDNKNNKLIYEKFNY